MLSNKKVLFWIVLLVIIITSFGVMLFLRDNTFIYKQGNSPEVDKAVSAAISLYKEQSKGIDLENGSCLTNDLIPGWVADIVHNPRITADDLPKNQCQAYIEGRAKHFVELDQKGNLIRVK
ncbi:MAG: hypothetical protein PHQ59_05295 [Candidatus Daviesbacteria bacterium]|nr:hypothetical protein [Candidatus Daviesbacteria bacterium]